MNLISWGFLASYHLIKKEETQKFKQAEKIELEDSKTDYKFLRPNLLIPTLRILSENKDNEYPHRIFELGTVFSKKSGIEESDNLIIATSPGNFTESKQILDYLTKMLDVKYEIKETQREGMIDGRTAEISINNKKVGYVGELHPNMLRAFNIKMPISVIEISLEELFKTTWKY